MKSSGLLSVLTFSEKRKDLLFFIEEEPRTLSEIREHFNVSSPEISPRIKEMEASNFIYKDGKKYYITPIGRVASGHLKPLISTLFAIEKNETFWKEHTLEGIPQKLLDKISALGECSVHQEGLENIYDSHKNFLGNIADSSEIYGVSTIFIPRYPEFFVSLTESNIPTALVLTKNVFEKVKNEYKDALETYMNSENTKLYLIDEAKVAFVVTDRFFSMSLFFKNGAYDPQNDLIGNDNAAIKWGKELFGHYKEKAKEIISL
ncbi:helix-turn-helix transcriptional regulator [Methanococcoides burtonii]|uniref:Transcriptional regulator n=1 Tax=Methanococcoides burtonii (strain DSM 6242 / NBRC 107633 / OCM 468 / ACE-M) TaxID=259564 RepID=Q12UR8_METBU|nr:winged helix-turn-helix domain-containing protein [Methanococcoides burtonii]ABE52808.1 transcriptional regulator [Methanococcoides burtonii DSM 6242]